jgi:hypothetical protein
MHGNLPLRILTAPPANARDILILRDWGIRGLSDDNDTTTTTKINLSLVAFPRP